MSVVERLRNALSAISLIADRTDSPAHIQIKAAAVLARDALSLKDEKPMMNTYDCEKIELRKWCVEQMVSLTNADQKNQSYIQQTLADAERIEAWVMRKDAAK